MHGSGLVHTCLCLSRLAPRQLQHLPLFHRPPGNFIVAVMGPLLDPGYFEASMRQGFLKQLSASSFLYIKGFWEGDMLCQCSSLPASQAAASAPWRPPTPPHSTPRNHTRTHHYRHFPTHSS